MIKNLIPASLVAICLSLPAMASMLTDNVPINVPQGESANQVENAILTAMAARGWVASARKPGEVDARLTVREHVANVRITYDANGGTIDYVDSLNLDYAEHDGQREIHRKYNEWVVTLSRDVSSILAKTH